MIHRSGSSARKRLPTSAATSRTRATTALSSVSAMVNNWAPSASIAPPITVDIMITLPLHKKGHLGVPQYGDERDAIHRGPHDGAPLGVHRRPVCAFATWP